MAVSTVLAGNGGSVTQLSADVSEFEVGLEYDVSEYTTFKSKYKGQVSTVNGGGGTCTVKGPHSALPDLSSSNKVTGAEFIASGTAGSTKVSGDLFVTGIDVKSVSDDIVEYSLSFRFHDTITLAATT